MVAFAGAALGVVKLNERPQLKYGESYLSKSDTALPADWLTYSSENSPMAFAIKYPPIATARLANEGVSLKFSWGTITIVHQNYEEFTYTTSAIEKTKELTNKETLKVLSNNTFEIQGSPTRQLESKYTNKNIGTVEEYTIDTEILRNDARFSMSMNLKNPNPTEDELQSYANIYKKVLSSLKFK